MNADDEEVARVLPKQFGTFTGISQIEVYLQARWRSLMEGAGTINCGTCHGCCRAGYTVGLTAAEAKVLPHTVVGPNGEAALVPNLDGTCPLLIDGECSVYPIRPRACREYDCRDFAYSGLLLRTEADRPGTREVRDAILRHMRDNGYRLVPPMRATMDSIITGGYSAMTGATVALIAMLADVLKPHLRELLLARVMDAGHMEIERSERLGEAAALAKRAASAPPP